MIRHGKKQDVLGLKQLWKESFGDEDAYIDSFFDMLYQDQHVLLEEKEGMLMGASFFLPGRIFTEAGWQDIRYVYALAVAPEYRGQKIATKLLDEAMKRYRTPLITEPADTALADKFYQPYGFQKCFYLDYCEMNLSKQKPAVSKEPANHFANKDARKHEHILKPEDWKITPVSAAEYFNLRRKHFQKPGYVEWPLEHVTFALREHRKQGGDALLTLIDGREHLLLYTIDNSKLIITETTFTSDEAHMYLPYLLPYLPGLRDSKKNLLELCSQIAIKSKVSETSYRRQLIGMAYGIKIDRGYLNLTLD